MTSPSAKDPHAAVLVPEPLSAPLPRIPDLLLALAAVSLFVFAGPTALFSFHPLTYTVFPLVIWATLRFGQSAATRRTFVASGLAIWGTVGGYPHSWHPDPSIEGRFDERMRNGTGEFSPPSQTLTDPHSARASGLRARVSVLSC